MQIPAWLLYGYFVFMDPSQARSYHHFCSISSTSHDNHDTMKDEEGIEEPDALAYHTYVFLPMIKMLLTLLMKKYDVEEHAWLEIFDSYPELKKAISIYIWHVSKKTAKKSRFFTM